MQESIDNQNTAEKVVLALMAHPDDAEFLCGGTLSLLAAKGWKIHIAAAAPGDCGTSVMGPDEIAAIRRQEGHAAAKVLGGQFHCLEKRDLQVFYDLETLMDACGLLRQVRPSVVITHSPVDYMVDHEQISLVARAAAFGAPIPNAPAPPDPKPLEGVPHLYYADPVECKDTFGETVLPTLLVDISSAVEKKLEMLACHASQREWLREQHGMDEYLESAKRWDQERGRLAGFAAAEGFRQHRGHAYPQNDVLLEVLNPSAISFPQSESREKTR